MDKSATDIFPCAPIHKKRRLGGSQEDIQAGNVVVEGVPYGEHLNIVNNKEHRTQLTESNVYWVQTDTGRWIACLKNPNTDKLKKISVLACQGIWPNVSVEDCNLRVILRPGLTRPYLPDNYVKYKKKLRDRNKKAKQNAYNIRVRPHKDSFQKSYMSCLYGFFASAHSSIESSPTCSMEEKRCRLMALLEEFRLQSIRSPELFKETAENSELGRLKTLDDLRVYPYARFLLQFFDFFFPVKDKCASICASSSEVTMSENSGGNS